MVRTLGTLIAATSGSAVVAGLPVTADNGTRIRQRISIMPENPGLYLRLFALILLAADIALWRVVSALFDRERLITGAKAP